MALLDNSAKQYHEGTGHGNYQFASLEDIINQFITVYVGEEKVITKARRIDVAFHAQRALQELSFDTFKSVKSYEIVLPPSLTMVLPQDYVNYVKLSWSDSAGVEHNLYPVSKTSNPFKIKQDDEYNYEFIASSGDLLIENADFSSDLSDPWFKTPAVTTYQGAATLDEVEADGGVLEIISESFTYQNQVTGRAYAVWQAINVLNIDTLDIKADGSAAGSATGATASTLRFGISSTPGDTTTNLLKTNNPSTNDQISTNGENGPNFLTTLNGTPGYIEWVAEDSDDEEIFNIDVSMHDTVYVLITCFTDFTATGGSKRRSTLDNIEITYEGTSPDLVSDGDSTTWSNYKSKSTEADANPEIYSYDSDIYDFNVGKRYGIDPQHAQINGSFFIDDRTGKIYFSSNISGKTIILEYISDSLGTGSEMRVHKFAEEAMYKYIIHAILSGRANIPEYIINRFKKEKRAAIRNAKLRLSNIKLEEITQILRGKSKQIKH